MSEQDVLESDQVFETREEGVAFVRRQLAAELSAAIRAARSGEEIGKALSDFKRKWNQTRVRLRVARYSGGVYLCKRPANLRFLPQAVDHHWLKTDRFEAGMGGDCPVPGQGCSDFPLVATRTMDHSGQSDQLNATCQQVGDIEEACVDAQIAPGRSTGRWLPWNHCQSFASRILVLCRTK